MKIMMKLMAILVGVVALVSGANASDNASNKAGAQDERGYAYGPVTEVDYIHVEYGHFEEYIAWVTSTWVPTMEAAKKAGLIIGYKVFQASPKSQIAEDVSVKDVFSSVTLSKSLKLLEMMEIQVLKGRSD